MNSIDYQIIESEPEPTPAPSPEPEEEPEEQELIRTLVITTRYKNHIEARGMYRFNNKQNDMLLKQTLLNIHPHLGFSFTMT